ncbi:cell wall protein RBR3 isoform X2 [Diachasma alloeum]|nr:cell wall protein RBR3 isoform X2 [Diachasma alloeum]
MKVQQESAEVIPQSKKKDLKSKSKPDDNPPEIKEIPSASSDTNGKASVESHSSQSPKDNGKERDDGVSPQPEVNEPKEIVVSETESTNSEVIDLVEISDDSLVLEFSEKPEEALEKEQTAISSEQKQSEPSSNDANPADVLVESTTSESCPPSDLKSQENPSESNEDQVKPEDDPSFVSYDSTIMLKDVQIKLNDCLRDNSKMMDVTDPNASMSEAFKDLSFGRTLRGISGRNSIGRMRHVTLRDRQRTPNDSLFVNTSSASFSQDDALRYTPGFLDSPSRNGTPSDRKRKLGSEVNDSAKKPRQEESSIFNTSLEYIKNLRRPVQVSTPNPKGFKFDIGEKSEGDNENVQVGVNANVEPKKWCVVM